MTTQKKAVLAVSFGTSYEASRKAAIESIEAALAEAFPDAKLYRAWTSKMIIRKLKDRDGLSIDTVSEAMERMISDGITDVIVQPTHVMNGIENDTMIAEVQKYADSFASVRIGTPLLTSEADCKEAAEIIRQEFSELGERDALVLMGHGSDHYANTVYAALNYRFRDMGCPHIFLGTVEAYPDLDSILRGVRASGAERVVLAPFMIVAGDHATNDLAGDDADSWLSRFKAEGFQTEVRLKGLGEYPAIREMIVRHAKEA